MLALFAACGQAPAATPTTPPDPAQALIGTWTTTLTNENLLRVMPDFNQKFLYDNIARKLS